MAWPDCRRLLLRDKNLPTEKAIAFFRFPMDSAGQPPFASDGILLLAKQRTTSQTEDNSRFLSKHLALARWPSTKKEADGIPACLLQLQL